MPDSIPRCVRCNNTLSSTGPEDGPPYCTECGRGGQPVLQFISSNPLRKNIGPEDQPAITVQELYERLYEFMKMGHGAAAVCFDAEVRSFDAHYIDVHTATCEDIMGDGSQQICVLTTRYH